MPSPKATPSARPRQSPPPPPPWLLSAAKIFCNEPPLPRPALYGSPPRRDVIGWVASLLSTAHTARWLDLCAVLRMKTAPGATDESMDALVCRVIESVVLPLQDGETKRVLTTNLRRHVRRGMSAGLTLMHVFDFYLALFDLEEGLHRSVVSVDGGGRGVALSSSSSLTTIDGMQGGDGCASAASVGAAEEGDPFVAMLDEDILSSCSALMPPAAPGGELIEEGSGGGGASTEVGKMTMDSVGEAHGAVVTSTGVRTLLPGWIDIFSLKFLFNRAVEKFRTVHTAVGTRHVREMIERETGTFSWARSQAAACGLDDGQARVLHLVIQKGSSCEGEVTLIRSHFTVFQENDPLVFAAELSTLDPSRAILVADLHVGLTVGASIARSKGGTMMRLTKGKSATNIRKLMYADALCQRRNSGLLSQESFMHVIHKLTMLNSGLGVGTPGSTWANIWPDWPPLDPVDKDVLEGRYTCGNIVAGALLAANTLANSIAKVGCVSEYEREAALQRLKAIAELGDAVAPYYIALALSHTGSGPSIPEALRYYRMAVDRGNKNAPAMLGKLLLAHGGEDPVDCLDLYKLSVARGGRFGQRFLGDLLFIGAPGVQKDAKEAWRLYEEAAKLGDPVAQKKVSERVTSSR